MSAHSRRLAALALAAIVGCASPAPRTTTSPSVGPLEVDVTGNAQDASLTVEALLARVSEQIARGANALAQSTVEQHVDVAQSALLSKQTAPTPQLVALAAQFDRATGGAAWEPLLQARVGEPARFAEFDKARARVLELLRDGKVEDACAAFPLPSAGQAVLAIESARLEGAAELVAGRFDEAERAFGRGVDAASSRPFERANLLLLRSGAAAHAGDRDNARRAWREAVEQAAVLATPPRRVSDPAFWLRAVNLRDPEEPWPDAALARIADLCRRDVGTRVDDGVRSERADEFVWTMIGAQRLARAEWRAALVAFGRAESEARDSFAGSNLRLAQAQALARLDDRSGAQALLTKLATDSEPEISRAACALLAAIELEQGRAARGVSLLERAVDAEPRLDWPQRGRAEANLGLARLLTGDADDGLRRLHAAQARFVADRAFADLEQCFENEIAYLEHAGRAHETDSVRSRMAVLRDL